MTDQPKTLPPLVTALRVRGYQVLVVLTFCDALAWPEVETPRCLLVSRPTLSVAASALLYAHRLWAKRVPLVVVTAVPIPAPLRPALERRAVSVAPLFASPEVLGQTLVTLASQEETL